jgi:hypothetical protein
MDGNPEIRAAEIDFQPRYQFSPTGVGDPAPENQPVYERSGAGL